MAGIILHEPEIPANTGNIGRTCVATGTSLHLIDPLGFQLTQKALKRAGMDYWARLEVYRYMNYEDFLEKNPGARIWYATTKARRSYSEADFRSKDVGEYCRKYFKGRDGVDTMDRMRILRLIENMTLGTAAVGYRTESLHGAGSPQAQRIMIGRQGKLEEKKALAKNIAGIAE